MDVADCSLAVILFIGYGSTRGSLIPAGKSTAGYFGLPANWIAADILRIQNGILVEHRDVIQVEATREPSKSGLPMFGETFVSTAGA